MNFQTALILVRSALRSVRYLVGGDVRFPNDRLGYVLEQADGDTFLVYRETALRSALRDESDDRVVLVFRMQVTQPGADRGVRDVLFDPFANVATPFFAGMPGFRRKLWLAGERPGAFLELYEWATAADADRFVGVLQSLIEPFDFAGEATFEVVEDDTIDEYVANRSIEWRRESSRRSRGKSSRQSARLALLALVVVVAAYLLWRRPGATAR